MAVQSNNLPSLDKEKAVKGLATPCAASEREEAMRKIGVVSEGGTNLSNKACCIITSAQAAENLFIDAPNLADVAPLRLAIQIVLAQTDREVRVIELGCEGLPSDRCEQLIELLDQNSEWAEDGVIPPLSWGTTS